MNQDTLREQLRDILFKAAGGISDMANEEIDQILSLIEGEKRLPKLLESSYKLRIEELENQLKVVQDFAEMLATLQKEGNNV